MNEPNCEIKTEPVLNKYQIMWAAIVPATGRVVTLADQKKLSVPERRAAKECFRHFPSNKEVFEWFSKYRELSKNYIIYTFSDAQYGKLKFGQDFREVLTKKQKASLIII